MLQELECADCLPSVLCLLLEEGLDFGGDLMNIRQNFIAELPFSFNVISAALFGTRLKEVAHSFILAELLKDEHIQKDFLSSFLSFECSVPLNLEREKENLDLSLWNKDYFVIIENKVNDAQEQPGQIARYVKIAKRKGYADEQIYVLYLNSRGRLMPSANSTTYKEDGVVILDALPILGERLIVRSYANDILPWLKSLVFEEKDVFLKSGVRQYIDYLERKFELLKEYEPMNKELNDYLTEKYNLEDISQDERILVLRSKRENAELLLKQLNQLVEIEHLKTFWGSLKRDFGTISEERFYNNIERDYCRNVGLGLEVGGLLMNFHIEVDNCGQVYYGVICNKQEYPDAYSKIQNYFKEQNFTSSLNWPIYAYSDFDIIYEKFKNLLGLVSGENS